MTKIVQYADQNGNRAYALTHWESVVGKPALYTKEEVDQLIVDAVKWVQTQPMIMKSSDGSEWISSISNEGVVSWTRKEEAIERNQDK